MSAVLVIGSGNTIGKVLLERLLSTTLDSTVYVLLRRRRSLSPETRLNAICNSLSPGSLPPSAFDRVHMVEGDITHPDLGLDPHTASVLIASVTHIINAAGAIDSDLPIAESAQADTTGARQILHFAQRCEQLKAVVQCTTAYLTSDAHPAAADAHRLPSLPLDVDKTFEQLKASGSVEHAASWLAATRLPFKCTYHRLRHPVRCRPPMGLRHSRGRTSPMMLTVVLATLTCESVRSVPLSDLCAPLAHTSIAMAC